MSAKVFIFTGAKGGSGTTTVCSELAKSLSLEGSVELVDADLDGKRSAALIFGCLRALDAARDLNGQVAVARAQGVTIAELASTFEAGFMLAPRAVHDLIASIDDATTVLVDAPSPFSAKVRDLVVRASRFIVVVEPTVLGVTSAKNLLANYASFGIPKERVGLVINNRSVEKALSRSDVDQALGAEVLGDLPWLNDRGFNKAVKTLASRLERCSQEPQLEILRAPVNGLSRDRRAQSRQPVATIVPAAHQNGERSGRDALKAKVHERLSQEVDLLNASRAQGDNAKMAELRAEVERITQDVLAAEPASLSAEELGRIKREIVNEALGLGPLEDFMSDPDITEIMVNGPDEIYIERRGIIESTTKRFSGDKQLRLVIERIIAPLGRRIDESSPMVDARLSDGSRVNAIIEPLALDGATLTIRRFGTHRLTADDLLKKGSLCEQMLDFLRACVEARLNIVISGGTGSGKTTFLNVLSGYLPVDERIITIEDAAELHLNQPHVVRLESRPANLEGTGEVRIRDLVRNSLRMRPDRIVVGECRGAEALDMLQAMNTGHDGSLTTIHANSARDALSRIETMVLMAGFDLPIRAIREQLSAAVDVVIQTTRLRDGSRKVTGISEVIGMEGDIVTMQEIVRFAQHGVNEDRQVIGHFEYTGVQPNALTRFEEYGVRFDPRSLSTMPLGNALW